MPVTQELYRLGQAIRRRDDGFDELDRTIAAIDGVLAQLGFEVDVVHPRPLVEQTRYDPPGKRIIEVSYLAYQRVSGAYHLAIKTVKVAESRSSSASEQPGELLNLLDAPRRLRHEAVEQLPELVAGLAERVERMLDTTQRRVRIAQGVLGSLRQGASPAGCEETDRGAATARSRRGQTLPAV